MLTTLNSEEYKILLEIFEKIKCDKWIATIIENYIYELVEKEEMNVHFDIISLDKERYVKRFGRYHGEYTYSTCYYDCICHYKDGKRNGESKSFYKSGQMIDQCFFKDGKIDGPKRLWNPAGQLCSEHFYKNGIREGESKDWWDDEQNYLKLHCHYKNGIMNGEVKEYHSNGRIKLHYFKKHKKNIVFFREWNRQGTLMKEVFYDKGLLEWINS